MPAAPMRGTATVVQRMRVRTPSRERAPALRFASMLAGADLRPAGLAPSAILCIRRLADPRPRRLPLDAGSVRPPADWENAARLAVARAAASAARPSLGPVPPTAGAVLFLDRAELLACLARDWCDDLFHTSWWWRALLGSRGAAETVLRAFRDAPQAVPAALHLLAGVRRLEPFLRRLAPADARAVTLDVARAFGLDAVENAIVAGRWSGRRGGPHGPDSRSGTRPATPAAASDDLVPPRVAAIAPEITPMDLDGEPRALAMVALVLHRAPATAAQVLRQDVSLRRQPSRRVPRALPHVSAAVDARAVHLAPATPRRDAPPVIAGGDTLAAAEIDPSAGRPEVSFPEAIVPGAPAGPPARAETSESVEVVDTAEVVETAFGGAFYLINVATALGLYADFTAPRGRNLPLPLWDFLAIAAERLGGPGFADDPLSALFGSLAGRGPDRPLDDSSAVVRRVRRLVPSLRRRIARGLGVHPNVAGPLLVMARARVFVAAATIDVRFSLADLPIEVRLAGLDRDPGFVPAAARTVGFAYV